MEFPTEGMFIDFEGNERLFEYLVRDIEAGYVVTAREKVDNGYEFESFSATSPSESLGDLRRKIRVRLSTKYIKEEEGNFSFTHDRLRGHISYGGVVIDGKFVTFSDLSKMLQAYEGSMFEFSISDLAEE